MQRGGSAALRGPEWDQVFTVGGLILHSVLCGTLLRHLSWREVKIGSPFGSRLSLCVQQLVQNKCFNWMWGGPWLQFQEEKSGSVETFWVIDEQPREPSHLIIIDWCEPIEKWFPSMDLIHYVHQVYKIKATLKQGLNESQFVFKICVKTGKIKWCPGRKTLLWL